MAEAGDARLTDAHPLLASLDLAESVAFYGRLGFTPAMQAPDYLIVVRDGVELHFWRCEDRAIAEATGCYVSCPDVDALHREWAAQPDLRLTVPEDKPWGMREFYVWDSSGNLLRVGQRRPG